MDVHSEVFNLARLLYLFCCEEELGEVPEVLANGPKDLAGVDVTLVPLQEFLGCSDILGDGLLRQDMLASEQCFLNEFWLDKNGKTVGVGIRLLSLPVV